MKKKSFGNTVLLLLAVAAAVAYFIYLYQNTRIKQEEVVAQDNSLEEWSLENSAMNGLPLNEDKNIYPDTPDTNIYDVYISVFPTQDETGNILDFSSFELHQSRDHTYNPILDCNVQIVGDGETLDPLLNTDEVNATIRVRGNSSRGDLYKSYKIRLKDDATTFMGQSILNINKHATDRTKISTKLMMDLLADMDNMAGFRTSFMRVWIRDTSVPEGEQSYAYYGLYTQIEQPNKSYLEAHGLSSNASLYKARNFSFRMEDVLKDVDDPQYDKEAFETVLSIREADDHKALLEMLAAVNDYNRDFDEVFHTYFNEDNFITWTAVNILMGNNDIITHNYILYHPENGKTWYFIPWDMDGSLRFGEMKSSREVSPESLEGGQKLNQTVLFSRYFKIPGNREKVAARMEELLGTDLSKEKMQTYLNMYKPVLAKTVTIQPDLSLMKMTPEELNVYLDGIHGYMTENYKDFKQASQYPVPMYVQAPFKNTDGTVHFAWDNSYSYEGYPVLYEVRVARDVLMTDVIMEEKEIVGNSFDSAFSLDPGTYYLEVTAVDSRGYRQCSFEYVVINRAGGGTSQVDGLLEFTVE